VKTPAGHDAKRKQDRSERRTSLFTRLATSHLSHARHAAAATAAVKNTLRRDGELHQRYETRPNYCIVRDYTQVVLYTISDVQGGAANKWNIIITDFLPNRV